MLCRARALECRLNNIIMMSIRHSQYLVLLNRDEDDLFVKKASNGRGIERERFGGGGGGELSLAGQPLYKRGRVWCHAYT